MTFCYSLSGKGHLWDTFTSSANGTLQWTIAVCGLTKGLLHFFSPLPAITPSCSAFPARFPMWQLWFSFLKLLFHSHSLQMDVKSLSSPRGTPGRGLLSAVTALSPFPHAFVPAYSWCVCQALLWIGSEDDEGFYLWDGNCGAATDMDAALS